MTEVNKTSKEFKPRVFGKIYFCGRLVFKNGFVSVGSGKSSEKTDSMIYRDFQGETIIPGTTFAGSLKNILRNDFKNDEDTKKLDEVFGKGDTTDEKNGSSSLLVFTDLYSVRKDNTKDKTFIQQGVRIDREYLSAQNTGKYDREISSDQEFEFFFYLEKAYDKINTDRNFYENWKERILKAIENGNLFFVGGRNTSGNGWGVFEDVKILDFDFEEGLNLQNFLLRKGTEKEFIEPLMKNTNHIQNADPEADKTEFKLPKNMIRIKYRMTFKDAFLINDPEADSGEDDVDFCFFKVGDNPTIPGSSIRGVFCSRSQMIVNTIPEDAKSIIEKVFGFSPDSKGNNAKENLTMPKKSNDAGNDTGENMKKSHIYFSYAKLTPGSWKEMLMNGVSIDRFTGGAVEGALFDFKLLNKGQFEGYILLEMNSETEEYLPFLYMVIRDIQEKDLSFGFGRTKGWGKVENFRYCVECGSGSDDTEMEKYRKYIENREFNLEALEEKYQETLKRRHHGSVSN